MYATPAHRYFKFIHSVIHPVVLWQVHSLFQSKISSVPSSASSFNLQYPFPSLRSSTSCLDLLPHLRPFYPPFFTSIMCCRRQFLHKTWQIQLAFLPFIVCRIFLSSLILCNTSSFLTWLTQLIFFILLQHHIPKFYRYFWSTFWNVQVSAPHKPYSKCSTLLVSFLNLSPICWWKE
jgi:hypothetical protein